MAIHKQSLLKSIIYIFVIGLIVMFFSFCKLEIIGENPLGGRTIGAGSLAETLLAEIGADLSSNNFSQSDINTIQSQARTTVAEANVGDSNDIGEVAPQVLKGLIQGIWVLDTYDEKIEAIEIIVSYLCRSLENRVSRSLANIMSFSSSGQNVSSSISIYSYETILEDIVEMSVQNLDDAGISSANIPAAIEVVVRLIFGDLADAGVLQSDYAAITEALTTAAVSSLDEAGINDSTREDAIESVTNGTITGLSELGLDTSEISSLVDEVTGGSVMGLTGCCVTYDDAEAWITIIKNSVNDALLDTGLTNAEILDLQSGMNSSAETAKAAMVDAKAITSFVFEAANNSILSSDVSGTINDTIALAVPNGTTISSLTPTIEFDGSSVNPESGIPTDFSSSIQYIVTAIDGTTRSYTTTVTVLLNCVLDSANIDNCSLQ
jgi:hypothetical protein